MGDQKQEWPFRLEMWDDDDSHVEEELIALVTDHAVARAAFVEAVRRRPGKLIVLSGSAHIGYRHRREFPKVLNSTEDAHIKA
jgi:hypothetical protein